MLQKRLDDAHQQLQTASQDHSASLTSLQQQLNAAQQQLHSTADEHSALVATLQQQHSVALHQAHVDAQVQLQSMQEKHQQALMASSSSMVLNTC